MNLNCLTPILRRGIESSRGIKVLPLLLVTLLPVTLQAQDYTYTINDGKATITGYTGTGGDVTVPDTIEGHRPPKSAPWHSLITTF